MNIEVISTDKEYLVIVNRNVLAEKAKSLGYDNVILFEDDRLDEDALSALKASGKAIVLAFDWTEKPESYKAIKEQIYNQDMDVMLVSAEDEDGCYYVIGDEGFSLQKLIEGFPEVKEVESRLISREFINTTDYTNRCGNCHAYLRENDRFCEQCGTERGKGSFLPYKNGAYCVYGPPIKTKFKCSACGHIWIEGGLGGHRAHYCPQCGKKTVSRIEERIFDMFGFDDIGIEEPYDIDERPRLFNDEQVRQLLSMRKKNTGDSHTYEEENNRLYKALEDFGIDLPKNPKNGFRYSRTELQGDQVWQARKILSVKGTELEGHHGKYCRYCGSNLVAAITYDVTGQHYSVLTDDLHTSCENNALKIDLGGRVFYDDEESKTASHPAYFCLCCGEQFGRLPIPDEIEKLYQKDIRKREAEERNRKLKQVAKEIGKEIGHKAKKVSERISAQKKGRK